MLKEVIRGAAEFGLEEAGNRILGPTAWGFCKVIMKPGLDMLRSKFPQLLGATYKGTAEAQQAATQAVRWVDTDPTFRNTVTQQLNALDLGQRQQLRILIEIREMDRKNLDNSRQALSKLDALSEKMDRMRAEIQHSPVDAPATAVEVYQNWYAQAGRAMNVSERLSLYTQAIDHNQNKVNAYYRRGLIYFEQKNFNSSFYDFNQAAELSPTFAAALTARGAASENLGQVDRAITDYLAASRLDPAEVTNYDNLTDVYAGRRDYTNAYRMAKLGLAHSPQDKTRYDRYVGLSWYAIFNRDFEGAIAYANNGIQLNPDNPYIYINLAHGLLFTNQFDRAWQTYLNTKFIGIKLPDGRYWEETLLKDFKDLNDAGLVHPKMDVIKINLCGNLSYYMLLERHFDNAAAYARQALTLDPNALWVYTNLAHSMLLSGRRNEAIEIYLRYKGQLVFPDQTWNSAVNNDFDELSKHGITHPDMPYIRRLLASR